MVVCCIMMKKQLKQAQITGELLIYTFLGSDEKWCKLL
jgi:hypothetical protein